MRPPHPNPPAGQPVGDSVTKSLTLRVSNFQPATANLPLSIQEMAADHDATCLLRTKRNLCSPQTTPNEKLPPPLPPPPPAGRRGPLRPPPARQPPPLPSLPPCRCVSYRNLCRWPALRVRGWRCGRADGGEQDDELVSMGSRLDRWPSLVRMYVLYVCVS